MRRSNAAWAVLCGWLILGGCASHPAGSVHPPVEPTPPLPDRMREGDMPAAEALPSGDTLSVPTPLRLPSRAPETGARHAVTPPPSEPAPPDTLPPPTISVRLTDEERARLAAETEKDLMQARECLSHLGPGEAADAQREMVGTLNDLINSAMAAREREDWQAAAQLARKARLLADKLVKS